MQGGGSMPNPGPETKKIAANYYARFGQWPPGLLLVLGSDPVPPDLVAAGEKYRQLWLRVEMEKELQESLHPPEPKTVTWTNDRGELVSISGFEVEEEPKHEEVDDDET
jgi:hypothetical protein